jgi:hypothetical protein
VVVLVLDSDTEVNMQGMLGFLENSTGLFLAEAIGAFDRIGAQATAVRRFVAVPIVTATGRNAGAAIAAMLCLVVLSVIGLALFFPTFVVARSAGRA